MPSILGGSMHAEGVSGHVPGLSLLQCDATQSTCSTVHAPGSAEGLLLHYSTAAAPSSTAARQTRTALPRGDVSLQRERMYGDEAAHTSTTQEPLHKPSAALAALASAALEDVAVQRAADCQGGAGGVRGRGAMPDVDVLRAVPESICLPGDTLAALTEFVLWLTQRAAASAAARRDADSRAVTLTTLHRSKGREWDHVFLVDACEGLLPLRPPPHSRGGGCGAAAAADGSQGGGAGRQGDDAGGPAEAEAVDVSEERRLLYVGMTRAKRTLCILWAAEDARGRACGASPFLAELPDGNCRRGGVVDALVQGCQAAEVGEGLWAGGVRVGRDCFAAVLEAAHALEVWRFLPDVL